MKNKPTISHDNQELRFSKKYISHIVSYLLIAGFLIFLIGYFLGKRKALQEISDIAQQDLFSDQIYYAFARMHGADKLPINLEERKTDSCSCLIQDEIVSFLQGKKLQYYAHIMSFGTPSSAQELVNRLQRNGINTSIIKHKAQVPNETGTAKCVYWYQVITDYYDDENEINIIVSGIKKIVKLNDIPIIKVENGSST